MSGLKKSKAPQPLTGEVLRSVEDPVREITSHSAVIGGKAQIGRSKSGEPGIHYMGYDDHNNIVRLRIQIPGIKQDLELRVKDARSGAELGIYALEHVARNYDFSRMKK